MLEDERLNAGVLSEESLSIVALLNSPITITLFSKVTLYIRLEHLPCLLRKKYRMHQKTISSIITDSLAFQWLQVYGRCLMLWWTCPLSHPCWIRTNLPAGQRLSPRFCCWGLSAGHVINVFLIKNTLFHPTSFNRSGRQHIGLSAKMGGAAKRAMHQAHLTFKGECEMTLWFSSRYAQSTPIIN